MRKWNLDAWNLVPWRVEAAAAILRLGRDQEARHLLEEQLTLTTRQDHRTRGRALSLLAVTVSDVRERARLLAQRGGAGEAGAERGGKQKGTQQGHVLDSFG